MLDGAKRASGQPGRGSDVCVGAKTILHMGTLEYL